MTDNNNTHKRGPSDNNQPANNTTNTDHTPINPPNSASADNGSSSASLSSRIQNSAHGLARSAFSAPSAAGDASLLAGGTGTDSKASGSSASSRQAFSAAQTFDETGASSSGSTRDQTSSLPGESFRSSPGSTVTEQQGGFALPSLSEEEFQASYGSDPWADTYTPSEPQTQTHTHTQGTTSIDKGKAASTLPLSTDGLAVSTLLSSSAFDPEFPPQPHEPFEPVETDLSEATSQSQSQHLTPEEIQMIDSFRRQMTPPPTSQSQHSQRGPHRLTPYSLVPDIDTILNSASVWEPNPGADTDAGAGPGTGMDATALRDTVLSSLPGSAEWIAVDERYHDEVWGYLRPALEAAREEINAKREGKEGAGPGAGEDGPAVRRLKMILKHMGGV